MRIMTWNIQNFDYELLFGIQGPNGISTLRRDHILNNFWPIHIGTEVYPDIIVIQEVMGPMANTGMLADSTTIADLMTQLIQYLNQRDDTQIAQWKLVPPLALANWGFHSSYRIAVLFRADKLEFHGPRAFFPNNPPINQNPLSTIITAANINAIMNSPSLYPAAFQNLMPNGTITITINQQPYNIDQNKLAGLPCIINGEQNGLRCPWLTFFKEINPPQRFIRIIACHAPSKNGPLFINHILTPLANYQQPADSVTVILGDFNYSIQTMNNNDPFNTIRNLGYTPAFNVGNPKAVANTNINSNIGMGPTMIESRNAVNITNNIYNNYNSYLKKAYGEYFFVDNIFTRYGTNAGGPAQNPKILDRVRGTPTAQTAQGAGYGIDMDDSMEQINGTIQRLIQILGNNNNLNMQEEFLTSFKAPQNYFHISGAAQYNTGNNYLLRYNYGVSDHMALVLDI